MRQLKKSRVDALISLAAGFSQRELIEEAKSLGLKVIAVDKDAGAICSNIVDEFICKSTHDAKPIIKELEKLQSKYRFLGVLNRSAGPPVITCAQITNHFNIPGVPLKSARTIVNKDLLRDKCKKSNIPIPKYSVVGCKEKINVETFERPFVIKPSLSLIGKSGITVVHDDSNISNALKIAKENTINKKILIEEYLPGPDITVVNFVENKKLLQIIVLEELNKESCDGTVSSRGYKVYFDESKNKYLKQIEDISEEIIKIFNISRSPFMACFRVSKNNNLKLIEIHLDLGGDLLIEELFPRALEFDYKKFAIKMCIGIKSNLKKIKVKPVAIFYDEGPELLNRRGFNIIETDDHLDLVNIIKKDNL